MATASPKRCARIAGVSAASGSDRQHHLRCSSEAARTRPCRATLSYRRERRRVRRSPYWCDSAQPPDKQTGSDESDAGRLRRACATCCSLEKKEPGASLGVAGPLRCLRGDLAASSTLAPPDEASCANFSSGWQTVKEQNSDWGNRRFGHSVGLDVCRRRRRWGNGRLLQARIGADRRPLVRLVWLHDDGWATDADFAGWRLCAATRAGTAACRLSRFLGALVTAASAGEGRQP